jgi:hypothetical protein
MQTREGESNQQSITIDRKIPLTWLFGIAGALALTLGGMWYNQQRNSETTIDIKADVKSIRESIAKQERKAIDDDYAARDLQRRVTVIEATLQAQRDQQSSKGSK